MVLSDGLGGHMPLIVGLGNPGKDYRETPHNLGFEVLDRLARRWSIGFRKSRIAEAEEAVRSGANRVVLLKPLAYMNLSGRPVSAALRWYGWNADAPLVICDDVNLPPGTLRFRNKGGAGGHKGLQSIIEQIGEEFPRLRIGAGGGSPGADVADYVLARPTGDVRALFADAAERAADAVESYLQYGLNAAMNDYNTPRAADDHHNPSGEDRSPDAKDQREKENDANV
ncbi:MAG: aminoacyl-tRNA hydrolase [bacterium]|nr:aminoacyl-tRNA hydrolase [bacterium]